MFVSDGADIGQMEALVAYIGIGNFGWKGNKRQELYFTIFCFSDSIVRQKEEI